MMKFTNKLLYIATALLLVVGFARCTDDFNEMNTDPNGVSVDIRSYLTIMEHSVYDNYRNQNYVFQLQQNLNADVFSGYMMPPTPFNGGKNNTNYYMMPGWNGEAFKLLQERILKNFSTIELLKKERVEYEDYYAVAKILRVLAAQRVTDIYGPIVYSEFGKHELYTPYDSQEAVYKTFFDDLNSAITHLTNVVDNGDGATPLAAYDYVYDGDYKKWVVFANSLRLRVAMRLTKVAPALAKEQAELACKHKFGVFKTNDQMALVNNKGVLMNPLGEINSAYTDIRMGAPMESILVGLKDPRLAEYFTPCTMDTVNSVVYKGQYKGIRNGVNISAKESYVVFSALGTRWDKDHKMTTPLPIMYTAEAYFLRAEAKLRGWDVGAETVEELYNKGIELSFEQWGVSDATYITNSTNKAVAYVDPKNTNNNSVAVSDITVKWEEGDNNERKLERIMTQKWISMFPEGQEAWSEFRRTGYPKLFTVVVNNSENIKAGDFIRRLPFAQNELKYNAAEVAKAVTMLGGPDNEATRLWWDVNTGNF